MRRVGLYLWADADPDPDPTRPTGPLLFILTLLQIYYDNETLWMNIKLCIQIII